MEFCFNTDITEDPVMGNTNTGSEESELDAKDRCRKWCFTHYPSETNYIEEGYELECVLKMKDWEYLFSVERCPKTDRIHFQGFIIHKEAIYFNVLRKMINGHISKAGSRCRKGTSNDKIILNNWNYIKKERRQFWTNINLQGRKDDEDIIIERIRESVDLNDTRDPEYELNRLKYFKIVEGYIVLPTDLKYTFQTLSRHKKEFEKINLPKGIAWKCPGLILMTESTKEWWNSLEYKMLEKGIVQSRLTGETMLIADVFIMKLNV